MNKKDTDILKLDVHEITSFMRERGGAVVPAWMVEYIDWMEKARDWYYRNKSEGYVVNQLVSIISDSKGKVISRYVAKKVFADSMNFFYANQRIRKQAWRNVLVEKLNMMVLAQFEEGDYEGAGKNIDRMHKFLELDTPDSEGANRHLLDRRPIVYFTNPEDLGVERISKNDLARLIDTYDVKEAERQRVKREAGVLERRLFPERSIQDVEPVTEEENDTQA